MDTYLGNISESPNAKISKKIPLSQKRTYMFVIKIRKTYFG